MHNVLTYSVFRCCHWICLKNCYINIYTHKLRGCYCNLSFLWSWCTLVSCLVQTDVFVDDVGWRLKLVYKIIFKEIKVEAGELVMWRTALFTRLCYCFKKSKVNTQSQVKSYSNIITISHAIYKPLVNITPNDSKSHQLTQMNVWSKILYSK